MIQLPDFINGLFECLGGVLCWMNVRRLLKDRKVTGVYWPATAFFSVWGLWNLFYYPHLGQWFSFTGGLVIAVANSLWVALAIKWRNAKEEFVSYSSSDPVESCCLNEGLRAKPVCGPFNSCCAACGEDWSKNPKFSCKCTRDIPT